MPTDRGRTFMAGWFRKRRGEKRGSMEDEMLDGWERVAFAPLALVQAPTHRPPSILPYAPIPKQDIARFRIVIVIPSYNTQ